MSLKRKIITSLYPLQMKLSKLTGKGINVYENKDKVQPPKDFYSLKATLNNGEEISFEWSEPLGTTEDYLKFSFPENA